MKDATYHLLVGILDAFLWGGDLIGEQNLPENGPAVFISNHLGPMGPIGAICSLPLRMYPWIMGDMVDREKAAAYLNWDFVERTLGLKPPLSMSVAKLLSKITVPMLTSFGVIPAYQGYEDMDGVLRKSVGMLKEGRYLLIFPEDNQLPMDSATKMSPFKKGFARLGELYYAETGQCLRFYPVTVHETQRTILAKPVVFNPKLPVAQERLRIKSLLEANIRRTYIEISIEGYEGIIQPS
jgi:1-acyl-sn-glycerol-3-phosphate acyltransferase